MEATEIFFGTNLRGFHRQRMEDAKPDCVRESLTVSLPSVFSIAEKTEKISSCKNLRILSFLNLLKRENM